MMSDINSKDQLRNMNEKIRAIEKGGHLLEIRRPDLGLVAKLQPSRLQLILNDGHHVQIIAIDLSDPENAHFLHDLVRGFQNDKGLALRSIEHAIVRTGCLVKAMTQPMFSQMTYESTKTVSMKAGLDESGAAISLEGTIGSGAATKITEPAALQELNKAIKTHFGSDKMSLDLRASSGAIPVGIHPQDFFEWMITHPPAATTPLPARSGKGGKDVLERLESILTCPLSDWKEIAWNVMKDHLEEEIELAIENSTLHEENLQRARLQMLIDEIKSKFTPSTPVV